MFKCPDGDTWNTKPPLDAHVGTFLVPARGTGPAVVLEDLRLTFQCPWTTTKYGFELKPVNDYDSVTWDITKGGLVINCT